LQIVQLTAKIFQQPKLLVLFCERHFKCHIRFEISIDNPSPFNLITMNNKK